MKTEIQILKAFHGDCILVKTIDSGNEQFNILIDGGPKNTFNFALREALRTVNTIHLLILTHIDSDHIGGVITFVQNSRFAEIDVRRFWINCANLQTVDQGSGKISFGEAVTLEKLLLNSNIPLHKFTERITSNIGSICYNGVCFDLLSPPLSILDDIYADWPKLSKEYFEEENSTPISMSRSSQLSRGTLPDLAKLPFTQKKKIKDDLFNAASIAFVLHAKNCSALFLADARPELIEASLKLHGYNSKNKLKVDFVKVSHHGSKNNTSCEMLDMIDSQNFVFLTNGGVGRSKHPDRETIARILYHPERDSCKHINLFFNYPLSEIVSQSGIIFTLAEIEAANASCFDDVCKLP